MATEPWGKKGKEGRKRRQRGRNGGGRESTPRLSFSQFSVSRFLTIQLEGLWLGNTVTPDGCSGCSCCDVIDTKWSML